MRTKLAVLSLALGGLVALSAPASAASDGEALVLPCFGCHGPMGKSVGDMPTINGKSADFIRDAMVEFKNDVRKVTLMNRIAKGYSNEEISAIAEYFGRMK